MSSPPTEHRRCVALRCETDPRWLPNALAHLDALLIDHAHCEKKAAANALSLLQAYPEVPGLPGHMARLAREESGHLARVLQLLEQRGLCLGRDPGDPYAQALQALVRTCLLYTSDAADERSSVDLGGRRIIKKKKNIWIQRQK